MVTVFASVGMLHMSIRVAHAIMCMFLNIQIADNESSSSD